MLTTFLRNIFKKEIHLSISLTLFLFLNFPVRGNGNTSNFDNYTVNNGLSNNYIDCVFQDNEGWIWVGTSMGVERFDGIRFKAYNLYVNDTSSKEGLLVRDIFQAKNKMLYVCYEEYGLAYYNKVLDRFEAMGMIEPCLKNNITAKGIVEDNSGNLWVATKQGVLKYNPSNHTSKYFTEKENETTSVSDNYIRKIAVDPKGKLWVGTKKGLDYFDPEQEKVVRFSKINLSLQDDILDIWIDDKHKKWVGTSKNGVIIIDSSNTAFQAYIPDKREPRSFKVHAILQASNGEFWMGTREGLYIYNEQTQNTRHVIHNELESNSLVHNSALNILEDNKGDIWIGTRGGISHLSLEKQNFKNYKSIPGNKNYLNNSEIYTIWIDPEENVWIGTEKGGVNILNKKTGQFEYLTMATKNGLSSNCIKSIFPLDKSRVLIGTFQGGVNIYNRKTKSTTCLKYTPNNPTSLSNDIVWDIVRDKNKRIWVATSEGLDLFDEKSLTFSHNKDFENDELISWIFVDKEDDLWLGAQKIKLLRPGKGIIQTIDLKARGVFQDSQNRYWITTEDRGVILCDKYSGVLKEYNQQDGIASKLTYRIEEDDSGKLWISTANGLSCFDTEKEKFKNYTLQDGLQSNQFYYGASCKGKNGELYFGGINGVTVFEPKDIIENQFLPPLYITDLKIFNQSIKQRKKGNPILTNSISETKEIQIPYKSNVITIEFAALNYTNSNENKYKYMLDGFDDNWVGPIENRSATYTNLNPGEYTFKVIASNNNNIWNHKQTSIKLVITPPFYLTIWFKTLVTTFVTIILLLVFRFILYRRELRNELEFEKERAKNLHEIDAFKLKFLTNISHEIKTPLTLIIGPIKKMLEYKKLPSEANENIQIIERNAQHLLKLITQLLDYRKLQEGKLQIALKNGDIVTFCRTIFTSFKSQMEERNITGRFINPQEKIFARFEPNHIKIILNNLISNAIKYNKDFGAIDFFVQLTEETQSTVTTEPKRFVKIIVKDSGLGISRYHLDNIFTSYYSVPQKTGPASTGIGLAFAKELVELHKGEIDVESQLGHGSTFIVTLPISDAEPTIEADHDKYIQNPEGTSIERGEENKKVVLLIDDNIDILTFIKSELKGIYSVYTARNGKDGLKTAIRIIPDIIVTDIMMPDMDGMELCEKIKKDQRTSHVPIIMLSALSSDKNILKGFDKGVDAYVTKPFDIDLLKKKVENQIILRELLRKKYSKEMILKPSNKVVTSPDKIFLDKLLQEIEKEIDNPDLDINKLAKNAGVSRMQLYRKISDTTQMTVNELVMDIRLKRAAQVLSQHKMNISEVAYSVGFNDLSYFGKCFKKKYGKSPSNYMKDFLNE